MRDSNNMTIKGETSKPMRVGGSPWRIGIKTGSVRSYTGLTRGWYRLCGIKGRITLTRIRI